MPTSVKICIVGAGPRGTSVLSRINANRFEMCPHDAEIVVHVVDPFPPGPGRVWRTDQSERLLMNTVASQVTLFTDESVALAGPVVPGPSLHEWAALLDQDSCPEHIFDEAVQLGPNTYPSRALYGHYLEWVFEHLTNSAPPGVTVRVHRTTAVALDERANGRQLVSLADGTQLDVDAVVLALGHSPLRLTAGEAELKEFALRNGLRYVPPGNPADVDIDGIRPGEQVALRGMGLTFFDYLALFTSGRGGQYKRNESGGLTYLPSGREPVLYAGSRRGVPYHARGENQKGVDGRHEPRFLTQQVIAAWRTRPRTFMRDIWPLVDKEVRSVYYETLLGEAFVQDLDEAVLVRRHGIPPEQRWDWDRIMWPFETRRFAGREQFHRWLVGYLRTDAEEARRGNVDSPLKAALDVLRDLRNEIRQVVDHGGILGSSYRDELDRWYTPLNAFLSIGPPLSRIEEMTALVEAGILHATGPDMRVRRSPDGHGFLVDSPMVDEPSVTVTTFIEARVPGVDLRRTADPLLGDLFTTGQATTYRIPDEDGHDFESGGLAVTGRPYRIIDAAGRPHPRRFAFGVPTEYVHWVTAVGVRPGVGSVLLEDADAIARTVLVPVADERTELRAS
jgi:hypothetical protein